MNKIILLLLAIIISACGPTREATILRENTERISLSSSQNVLLKLEFSENVKFIGQLFTDDNSEQANSQLYPANNGGELLVAILVHAAMEGSTQDQAKKDRQEEANRVLEPYLSYLQSFQNDDLVSSVISKLDRHHGYGIHKYDTKTADAIPSTYILTSKPLFILSQDQKELLLRNELHLAKKSAPDKVLHKNVIEMQSSRLNRDDIYDYWVNQNNMAKVAADLYGKSVNLFLYDIGIDATKESPQQKTFKILQGGNKSYERGTFIKSECGFTVIRNLRGWLKSFPDNASRVLNVEGCNKNTFVDPALLELSLKQ